MSKKPLLALFLVVATELIGFGLIIPVLPQMALTFQTSNFLIGVLMASYSAAQFISAPLLGSLSDKFGRRPVLVISKFGSAFAYLLMALTHSYWWFLAARCLDGFTGGNISVARAYVSDTTTPENRPKGMAIIGIAFGTGFILGPALGGFLFAGNSFTLGFIVAGALSLGAAILTYFILPEPETRQQTKSAPQGLLAGLTGIPSWSVGIILLTYLMYMTVFSGFETTFSIFTHKLLNFSVRDNSWLFVYIGLLSLVIQGTIARRSFKNLKLIAVFSFILFSVGLFLLAQVQTLPALMLSVAVMSFGIATLGSFLPALMSVYSDPASQGKAMGIYESIGSLSRIIGPLIAYSVIIGDPRSGYLIYAAITLGTGALLLLGLRKQSSAS